MDCPKCGRDSDFSAWLDRVSAASFRDKWISTACPACGEHYQIRLHRNGAEIGVMEGAPGPAFIPYKMHRIPGIAAKWSENVLRVRHGGRHWRFPTGRA